ncbi:MAG: type II secretion system GspH family protein [Proteobacteria bacterium]|nr:type II secretion system GspH family protein [Pseudomonadota bacterium]
MKEILKAGDSRGFTLIEIIAVLVVLSVLSAFVVNRIISTASTDRIVQESAIKSHIRYAQATAMKQGTIWGIKCNGTDYWLFTTNDPDTLSNKRVLPGEENVQVALAGKRITMSNFTVFFDVDGRPYTAYTDASTNTPVSTANPISITVDSYPADVPVTFGITPETGFMP